MRTRWSVAEYDAWPKRVLFPVVAVAIDLVSLAAGLIGLWVATSVAVHLNVSMLWAVGVGLALFPGVPIAMEIWHRIDRRRYGETEADHPPPRVRILRSALRVNAALLVVALIVFPRVVFTAVATRGDWMMEGARGPWRDALLAVADRAEVLLARDNRFAEFDDSGAVTPDRTGWDRTRVRSGAAGLEGGSSGPGSGATTGSDEGVGSEAAATGAGSASGSNAGAGGASGSAGAAAGANSGGRTNSGTGVAEGSPAGPGSAAGTGGTSGANSGGRTNSGTGATGGASSGTGSAAGAGGASGSAGAAAGANSGGRTNSGTGAASGSPTGNGSGSAGGASAANSGGRTNSGTGATSGSSPGAGSVPGSGASGANSGGRTNSGTGATPGASSGTGSSSGSAPSGSADGVVTVDPDHDIPLIIIGPSDDPEPPPPPPPPPSSTPAPPPPPRPTAPPSVARQRYIDWLRSPTPHALATNIPASEAGSYETVARYLATRVRDPFELTKAVHDFIAVRIAYDADFDPSRLPPSDPAIVFERREAVCAGYARLFKAMMETLGFRAVYISGDARFAQPRNPDASHAWNAVEIDGRWYLVDVTWDAGHVDGRAFVKKYRTDYLLAPPDIFVLTHFPQQTQWQLLDQPLSHGAFLRQPLLLPRFFAYGFGLVTPDRSQITVASSAHFEIDNPLGASVFFAFAPRDQPTGPFTDCVARSPLGRRNAADCRFSRSGDFFVYVFAAPMGVSKHEAVARFEVNSEAPSG